MSKLPKFHEAMAKAAQLNRTFFKDREERQKEIHDWIRSGGLTVPTLIIWGFNDESAPLNPVGLDAMRLIFPNVPKAQMHILNHAGHISFREQSEAFNEAIKGFIQSI